MGRNPEGFLAPPLPSAFLSGLLPSGVSGARGLAVLYPLPSAPQGSLRERFSILSRAGDGPVHGAAGHSSPQASPRPPAGAGMGGERARGGRGAAVQWLWSVQGSGLCWGSGWEQDSIGLSWAALKEEGASRYSGRTGGRVEVNGHLGKASRKAAMEPSDVTQGFCTARVVMCCNKLPKEVMGAPSLQAFKAMLDGALSSLI